MPKLMRRQEGLNYDPIRGLSTWILHDSVCADKLKM